MSTRIGIIEVGDRPEELSDSHPSYAEMIDNWLSPVEGQIKSYPILKGHPFPSPDDADLWAITGSRHGVYEEHSWIPPLMEFIVRTKHAGIKMLGICFGHQIIAQALGGSVIKSEKGWGVGLFHYSVDDWPIQLGERLDVISINAYHQDQVIARPPESILLASSEFCPNAALWYPDFAITFQGHPEFSKQFQADLINFRNEGGLLPNGISDPALKSLSGKNNQLELGTWFAQNWENI